MTELIDSKSKEKEPYQKLFDQALVEIYMVRNLVRISDVQMNRLDVAVLLDAVLITMRKLEKELHARRKQE